MDTVESFFKETNFDILVTEALKQEIAYVGKNTDEPISGFGLYTGWAIDCSPSDFWIVSLLSEEGEDDLDDDEKYAVGSWDGFDQESNPEASAIVGEIYKAMWAALEDVDEKSAFYESVMGRCAELLVSCIPLIKEHFTTTDLFIVSIAEHDEDVEAMKRMQAVAQA